MGEREEREERGGGVEGRSRGEEEEGRGGEGGYRRVARRK